MGGISSVSGFGLRLGISRGRLVGVHLEIMEEPLPEKALAAVQQPQVETIEDVDDESAAFECNICYELSREPVVTFCGHLYCWPCLYRYFLVCTFCGRFLKPSTLASSSRLNLHSRVLHNGQ